MPGASLAARQIAAEWSSMTQVVGHRGEKPNETLVRFIVEQALGVRVCSFDDRRGVSRVDAIVHRQGGVPLEIVSAPWEAGNRQTSALRKRGSRKRFNGLRHGYKVCLTSEARINDLAWVEPTLRQLEDPAKADLVPSRTKNYYWIVQFPFVGAGEVLFTQGGGGGRPAHAPADVVTTASAILARTEYGDVPRKLGAYGGDERHAFLIVDRERHPEFGWLRRATVSDLVLLPEPLLPPEVTHFWISPRTTPGLTLLWSAVEGWQGTQWRWGDPVVALGAWDDPVCPVEHEGDSAGG